MSTTGLTRDAGWQVGVRKTFPILLEDAWKLITSQEGISAWLGKLPGFQPGEGAEYRLEDGAFGKFTVFKPGSHMRLTWQPGDYPRPSIIQVRVISAGDNTVIAFHQEHLPDAVSRGERKQFFNQVVADLSNLIKGK